MTTLHTPAVIALLLACSLGLGQTATCPADTAATGITTTSAPAAAKSVEQLTKGDVTLLDLDLPDWQSPARPTVRLKQPPVEVYLPADYKTDREWPAVLIDGMPMGVQVTTANMAKALDGKFIVVNFRVILNDLECKEQLERLLPALCSRLKIDRNSVFLSGSSCFCYGLLLKESATDIGLAGYIMAHPPQDSDVKRLGKDSLKGRSFLLLEDKERLTRPDEAAAALREHGAEAIAGKSQDITKWIELILTHQAKLQMASAQGFEDSNKLGTAYVLYLKLAKNPYLEKDAAAACAAAAEKLGAKVTAQMAEANKCLDGGDVDSAVKLLTYVSQKFEGSSFGEQASKTLEEIRKNPDIKAAREKIKMNQDADHMETLARAAENAKEMERAIKLYEQYVAMYPRAERFDIVFKHLKELQDGNAAAKDRQKQADKDCRNWLNMADNYIKSGKPENAKPYLQKVIDKYGDTDYAKEAKEKLAKLK